MSGTNAAVSQALVKFRRVVAAAQRLVCRGVAGDEGAHLSEREVQIARMVVDGLRNQEIADRLRVSKRTVQTHLANAMSKTGTNTRTQLAVHVLRAGIVALDETGETEPNGV